MMLVMLLGMFFISSIQPMLMVISLILITSMYSFVIYLFMGGYWFSYALMMVMLSGVLVLFTYVVSLIPNESFESYNLLYLFIFMVLFVSTYLYMFSVDLNYSSLCMWISYFGFFLLFMVGFLLSMMLVVVWLSYMHMGAMRIN